jgi:tetratricopeptide (TPR) repeat protein
MLVVLAVVAGLAGILLIPHLLAWRSWNLADRAARNRDFPAAIANYRDYLKTYPRSEQARFELARALRRNQQFEEAAATLRECQWIGALVADEQLLLEVQQRGTAQVNPDDVARLRSTSGEEERIALEAMVAGDLGASDLLRAESTLDQWVAHFPDDVEARLKRGALKLSLKRLGEAREDLQKATQLAPEKALAWRRLAELDVAEGVDPHQTLEHFQSALSHDPQDVDTQLGVGRCELDLGNLKQAQAAADRALELQPESPEAFLLAAEIAEAGNDPEASLNWLERARKVHAPERKLRFLLARVLRKLGRSEEAKQHEERFQQIVAIDQAMEPALGRLLAEPENAERHWAIAELYRQLGDGRSAERWYLSALSRNPRHIASHRALAELYDARGDEESKRRAAVHRRLAEEKP